MKARNTHMEAELGNAIVDASIKLEEFFYTKYPKIFKENERKWRESTNPNKKPYPPALTLGNPIFNKEVTERLPHGSDQLFAWFNRTRNAIIHYGVTDDQILENREIREKTTPEDLNKAVETLRRLLRLGKNSAEEDIREVCKEDLTSRVFDEVFGNSREDTPPSDIRNRQSPQGGAPAKSPSEKQGDIWAQISTGAPPQKSSSGNNGSKNRIELDRLDDSKKPSRRQRQKIEAEAAAASSKVEAANANALDLVAEDQKPKTATASAESGGDDFEESDDPKLIVIKPPILVPDLAARLGLKPLIVNGDLIKLGVFPAPNQPLDPEIAAQVCEIHGFTFERK